MKEWAISARRSGHSITQADLWWEFKHALQVKANDLAVQAKLLGTGQAEAKRLSLEIARSACLQRIMKAEGNLQTMKSERRRLAGHCGLSFLKHRGSST